MNTNYNPWSDKPRWCQPWTILLTGFSIIGGSWLLFHRVWVTALVTIPLGVWMGFFVLLWPNLMRTAMAEAQANASVQND
jgi:hypothetical protein